MINIIEFKGAKYPAFQATGFASRFAFPFAQETCKGIGYDIGCGRLEWALPENRQADVKAGGRIVYPIDPALGQYNGAGLPAQYTGGGWTANNLPMRGVDFIFSSHCLEHVPDWTATLNYWHEHLTEAGVLFLYLPDHSQVYWRPHHNRKHIHALVPQIIKPYFTDQPERWTNIFVSGVDLNNSFMVIAQRV